MNRNIGSCLSLNNFIGKTTNNKNNNIADINTNNKIVKIKINKKLSDQKDNNNNNNITIHDIHSPLLLLSIKNKFTKRVLTVKATDKDKDKDNSVNKLTNLSNIKSGTKYNKVNNICCFQTKIDSSSFMDFLNTYENKANVTILQCNKVKTTIKTINYNKIHQRTSSCFKTTQNVNKNNILKILTAQSNHYLYYYYYFI